MIEFLSLMAMRMTRAPIRAWLWLSALSLWGISNAVLVLDGALIWRLLSAVYLLFVLPGVLLLLVILPCNTSASISERGVLSAGLSIALSVVGMWLLYLLPVQLKLETLLYSWNSLALALGLAAWYRNRNYRPAPLKTCASRYEVKFLGVLLCVLALNLYFVLTQLHYTELSTDERSVLYVTIDVLLGKESSLYLIPKGPAQVLLTMWFVRLTDSLLEAVVRLPFALCATIATTAVALTARLRFKLPVIGLMSVLLILEGLLLELARWVQYQMLMMAMLNLALYCGLRGWQSRCQPAMMQYWLLCAIFGSTALLVHYDALFIGPALLYLFVRSLQKPIIQMRNLWRFGSLAGLVLIISVPFYWLLFQQPESVHTITRIYLQDSGRVGFSQAPFNHLPEFLAHLWYYESFYRVPVMAALICIASYNTFAERWNHSKWLVWSMGICVVGTLIAIWQPQQLVIANINWGFLPVTLLGIFLLGWCIDDPFWKTVLLWALVGLAFPAFMMSFPQDHFFSSLYPLSLIAARGMQLTIKGFHRAVGKQQLKWWSIGLSFCVSVWLLLLARYAYLQNIAYLPTQLMLRPDQTPTLFPQLASPVRASPASINKVGWRVVALLYESGLLRGEYDTAMIKAPDWYLYRIWNPPRPAPRYYFLVEQPFINISHDVPRDLRETHFLWGTITVQGDSRMYIYQKGSGEFAPQPRVFAAEDFEHGWANLITLKRFELFKTYQRNDADFYALSRSLESLEGPSDALIADRPLAQVVLGQYYHGRLSFGGTVERITDNPNYRRIWGVFWASDGEIERALAQRAYPSTSQWFGNIRLRLYGIAPEAPLNNVAAQFGDLSKLVSASAIPQKMHANELLPLQMIWRVQATTTTRYKLFVHVANAQGAPAAQADDEPVVGLRPTNGWRVGETISDRVGIWLPPDIKPGAYHVVVGLYDPATGNRLPASTFDGTRYPNDAVPLGKLIVE